ncbi:MAG: hypothetical protein CMH83_17400 [Nocardioides sp.]|nr:hypothetical protein [Nocardioides sp.]
MTLLRTRAQRLRHRTVRRTRDERGAVAVMTGVLSLVLVLAASLAVDLGMQRVVRADVQALVDMVSLDAARLLDGRTAGEIRSGDEDHDPLDDVVAASQARNQGALGDVMSLDAVLVTMTTDALGGRVPERDGTGALVGVSDDVVPDAVLVEATGEVDFAFSVGEGQATRDAMAASATYACFRIGSFAAALSSGDSSIAGVFEAIVQDTLGINLNAIGYEGLLTTNIDVAMLGAQLGAGTAEELADLGYISVEDLLDASAYVLGQQGEVEAQAEVAQMAQNATAGVVLEVADILSTGDGSVLEGKVNVVDLLGSAALSVATVVSNSNNFLDTGVAWSAPHVANGIIQLSAIEAPQQACGKVGVATAHTAQVSFLADLAFTLPNKVAYNNSSPTGRGDLLIGIPTDPTNKAGTLHMEASLAKASGLLVEATCGDGTVDDPDGLGVMVDTGLITTAVSLPFRMRGTLTSTGATTILPIGTLNSLLNLLFAIVPTVAQVELTLDLQMTAAITASTPASTATDPSWYWAPPHDYTDVEPTDAGGAVSLPTPAVSIDTAASTATLKVTTLLGSVKTTTVALGSLNLAPVIASATATTIGTSTSSVVANVNQALVPVSDLLGIRTAGADLLGVTSPTCGQPSLVG